MEANSDVVIPVNVAIRIFSFVSRDDLENCKLTCKSWKDVIDYADNRRNSELQLRHIDAICLSTNSEFSIKIYYNQTIREFYYKKYFADREIDEIEVKKVRHLTSQFDEKKYVFPCGEHLPILQSHSFVFPAVDIFHQHRCKMVRPTVYQDHVNYTRKLFTPPLSFYERLQRMLKKCKIRLVIFHAFTFTDFFVEKMREFASDAFSRVVFLSLHCCNLRCVSPNAFHEFLASVYAAHFLMDRLRNCVPNHFNALLLSKPSIQMARTFYVGFCIGRRTQTVVTFPIDDDDFINYVKLLGGAKRRDFFGIAICRVTQQFRPIYEKIITSNKYRRLNLYTHVLFGDVRYLSNEFGFTNALSVQQ
ncbi:hypothetical protein niasHT_015407 [Heterodera trifolii]|uniref:F-box domain-containing protein n=1 Tax=Heterodera trifolii TaxID=157864 RepID=A0ABD2KZU0_9BILA